jgi:hypothetical protein
VIGALAKMLEAQHDTTTISNYIKLAPADAAAAVQRLGLAVPELSNERATEASPPRNSHCSKLKQQKADTTDGPVAQMDRATVS